jgi:hypothetical protein
MWNSTAVFGVEIFTGLFRSLLSRKEIDVDVLIAMREEVCSYYTTLTLAFRDSAFN